MQRAPLVAAALMLIACPVFAAVAVEIDDPEALPATANYSCVVDIANNFDDCFDPVMVQNSIGSAANQRQVIVDLDTGFNWQSLNLRVEICNGSGFTVNIGDSPTNNGFGGDARSTSHDAEAQAVGTTLQVYRSDIGGSGLTCQFPGPSNPSGCITQQWTVRNDYLAFDSATIFPGDLNICDNAFIFDFPPYDEADAEDPTGLYEDKLYVGLNRSYASSSRNGSGIQRACFFLSTAANPNPLTIDAECGF